MAPDIPAEPILSPIVALTNIWDAMIGNRPDFAQSCREARKTIIAYGGISETGKPITCEQQMARVRYAVSQYRDGPLRSADWLAGELMTILETAPAND